MNIIQMIVLLAMASAMKGMSAMDVPLANIMIKQALTRQNVRGVQRVQQILSLRQKPVTSLMVCIFALLV